MPESGESTLAMTLTELEGILDGYAAPAVLLGLDYRILGASRAYRDLYGDGQPPQGRHCYAVSHHNPLPCDQVGEPCPLKASLETGEPRRVLHMHHTLRGQEHVDVETHPVRNDAGEIVFMVEVIRPVPVVSTKSSGAGLVGKSETFNHMIELSQRVASSDTTVLLLGASGTGKEALAQAVHDSSHRVSAPFVPVECSGLTESLFESELFGHEKGAFTGAHHRKAGLVEAARGGTLFLDEIGDIPLSQQVKLLRLLETGTYRRVGSTEAQQADFRLVCATHRNLRGMVQEGEFREDLYYRISAFPITLPALQERLDDLPLLIATLLERIAPERRLRVSSAAMACLKAYRFPGNVRELRNILERANLLVDGDTILPQHLPEECQPKTAVEPAQSENDDMIFPLQEVEQRYLRSLLAKYPHDRNALAEKLGISRRTLFRKLKEIT